MRVGAHPTTTRSVISLFFMVVLSLAQIAGQLGAAFAAPLTVECCCGEHLADQDCGCPDCPGAVFDSANEDDAQGSDIIRSCGQEGDQAAAATSVSHWNVGCPFTAPQLHALSYHPPWTADVPTSADREPSRAPS